MNGEKIVLFDGVCNLCENSVQFLIRNDKKGLLKYASLQSDAAKRLLAPFNVDERFLKSIVFIDDGEIYFESDAALRTCRYLKTPWKYLKYFKFVPKFIRDKVYQWIARNRYKWFGKKDACMIPQDGVKDRFLESWRD